MNRYHSSDNGSIYKYILIIFVLILLMFILTKCNSYDSSVVSSDYGEELRENISDGFIELSKEPINLIYDKNTYIVYINNSIYAEGVYSFVKTPYIAPNGFPYKYDVENKKIVEISQNTIQEK